MSNLKLDLNTGELLTLNSSTQTHETDISMHLKNISNSCEQLSNYVNSDDIGKTILKICDDIDSIQSKFSLDMEELSSFLKGQLENYELTVEEAVKALREALDFIAENFSVKVII